MVGAAPFQISGSMYTCPEGPSELIRSLHGPDIQDEPQYSSVAPQYPDDEQQEPPAHEPQMALP